MLGAPNHRHPREFRAAPMLLAALAAMVLTACGGSPPVECPRVRVLTLNIGNAHLPKASPEHVAKVVEAAGGADILLLQEVLPKAEHHTRLARELGYPYMATGIPGDLSYTNLLLSKVPLSQVETLIFRDRTKISAATCALAEVKGQRIYACNVHLDPTDKRRDDDGRAHYTTTELALQLWEETFGDTVRSRNAAELKEWLMAKGHDHLVVGGDFNTVIFSKTVRTLAPLLDDSLVGEWDYLRGTYKKLDFFIKPRVDYIFHSEGVMPHDAAIIANPYGDHDGVLADLALCPANHEVIQ